MAAQVSFMKALGYVFREKAWFKKLLIPCLYGLIPMIGLLILGGWGLKIAKNIIDGNEEDELPPVEFINDLRLGFFEALIDIIHGFPALLFMAASIALFALLGSSTLEINRILLIMAVIFGITGIFLIVLWLFTATVGFANFLAKGKLIAGFDFSEIIRLFKRAKTLWLQVIIGQLLIMTILAPAGALMISVGLLITTTYAAVVYAHLLGQAYQITVAVSRNGYGGSLL